MNISYISVHFILGLLSLNIFIYFKFTWKHDVPCDVLACLEIKEKFILWLAMRLLDMYYMNMYMKSSFTCMCNVY